MWRGIKKITSSNNSNHMFPTAITVNNKTISNPSEIANAFSNCFAKVAIDIQSSIRFSKKIYYDYLPPLNIKSFFLTPTDSTEVCNIIFSFKQNKSDGPNSIPIKILKLLNKDISDQLAILFDQSFSSGIFPSILKTSKIIPIYKKGSKLEFSNYRPISLLSNIDKILERLMYNRLYNFLEKKEIIFSLQFGFRQKYSTTHSLIHLTDKIRHEIDKATYACGIFVDFQQAFDTVDHDILLKKLEYYGVRGISNKWFASYLSNRKQFVSINGYKSNLVDFKCGVLQGSILGPLLFLIYINDLHAAIKYSEVHHFSDDINLLNFSSCIKSINEQVNYDLKNLSNWLKANKVLLNVGKTELVLLLFTFKKQLDCDLKIKLNRKRLYEADSVKYLGIQIDKRLTWKQQINHVAVKLNKSNAMLSKLRHVLDIKTPRSVYYAIFESHLCHASLVWAQNTNPVKRLHLLQKKSLRIMFFQSRNSHTGPLFEVSKILNSFDKTALENCIFISKSLKGLLPFIFNNWFKLSFESHSHDNRRSNLGYLKIPFYHTKTYGRYSMFVNSRHVWNHKVAIKMLYFTS